MSGEESTAVVTPVPTEPAGDEGATPIEGATPDETLGEPGKKALDAERARASKAEKDLAAATKKLKEIEDRDKSAEDRAKEHLAEVEAQIAETEGRANRAEVAATSGVPVEVLAGPKSSSAEDLQAYADTVTAYATEASKKQGPILPNQGKQPESAPVRADDWLRAAAR